MSKGASKTSLFLMEVILTILFFSICSAVCMRVFATAQVTAIKATNITGGVLAVENAVEVYKASDGNIEISKEVLQGEIEEESLYIYYDANWDRIVDKTEGKFFVEIKETEEMAIVSAYEDGKDASIFALKVKTLGGVMP